MVGSKIVHRTVRTGHVVSDVCSVRGCGSDSCDGTGQVVNCDSISARTYIMDMWSVLCVPYVGGGI